MSKSWLRTPSEQLNDFGELFGYKRLNAAARNSDPDTSHLSAAFMRKEKANRLEALVVSTLRIHSHGLTNHELVTATGVDWNTITPRIAPLVRKGLVYDSGERRKGSTNRPCIVWKST